MRETKSLMTTEEKQDMAAAYQALVEAKTISLPQLMETVKRLAPQAMTAQKIAQHHGEFVSRYTATEVQKAMQQIAIAAIQFVWSGQAQYVQDHQLEWIRAAERNPCLMIHSVPNSQSEDIFILGKNGSMQVGNFISLHFKKKDAYYAGGKWIPREEVEKWAYVPRHIK